jgi:hypothetical protein
MSDNKTTHELMLEAADILNELMRLQGDCNDEISERLNAFTNDAENKISRWRAVNRRANQELEFWRQERDRASANMARAKSVIERSKVGGLNLLTALNEAGSETNTPDAYLSTTTVMVAPPDALDWPCEYLIEQAPKLDRKQALKDLKSGIKIDGFALEDKPFVVYK